MNATTQEPTEASGYPPLTVGERPDEVRDLLMQADYEREFRLPQESHTPEGWDYGLDDVPCPFGEPFCDSTGLCGRCEAAANEGREGSAHV